MIGLYTQNQNTLKQLLMLMQNLPVEAYCENKSYQALIWLSDHAAPKGQKIISIQKADLPFTPTQWRQLVQKYMTSCISYENKDFLFDASLRLVTNMNTKEQIHLTEKETALLAFLTQAPNHTAAKEDILKFVWQYNPDVQTHTLESHFYALKQKLGTNAEKLIRVQNGLFCLI